MNSIIRINSKQIITVNNPNYVHINTVQWNLELCMVITPPVVEL
jgi:hypothetical protein